jgi:biotin carboxylase
MNEEFNDKRLLILGGSRISCEIVKRARNMGIITGVTDWYPLEYSPAKREADEAYDVSTSDIESMVKLVRDKKFDGVITGFTDSVLPYYAEICDVVGLPAYGTKEQFEIFTDKDKYKRLMRAFDIPTIPDYEVDINKFEETTADIEYPVIVKPLDGSGSRGVSICNNHNE